MNEFEEFHKDIKKVRQDLKFIQLLLLAIMALGLIFIGTFLFLAYPIIILWGSMFG
jgi:hypothetical protein